MSDNVIQLPRPREARTAQAGGLALYVRVGRNDHRDVLDVIAGGERGFFGVVVDANNAQRHRDLIQELRRRGFDVALDPRTQPMGTVGGHTHTLAGLPWGLERPHRADDFDGDEGRARGEQIAEFALQNQFTQVLAPTHILQSANDPWLRRDIVSVGHVRRALDAAASRVELIYSLALPIQVMRDPQQRGAVISAIGDAPIDAVWLKVDNFGADATGEKTAAYIEACRDFHELGIPVVADHVGGLPGLGLLAFGAVGGIAHGITLLEGFKADRWRRPPNGAAGRTPDTRVYLPRLDLQLKRADAEAFFSTSARIRGRYSCGDTHCCPGGARDMLAHPARHFIHQRAQQIEMLGSVPEALRIRHYLDSNVRRVSDDIAAAAGLAGIAAELHDRLLKKQRASGRFRDAMAHLAEAHSTTSVAIAPMPRSARESR